MGRPEDVPGRIHGTYVKSRRLLNGNDNQGLSGSVGPTKALGQVESYAIPDH